MPHVISVGSINLDYTAMVPEQWIAQRRSAYPWFPAGGATVGVEAVPDELAELYDQLSLGGKGANQAVAAAAAGVDATLVGAVGTDSTMPVRRLLRSRGVDVSATQGIDVQTGTAYVAVDPAGENYIITRSGANAEVTGAMLTGALARLPHADVVCLQNELPQEATMAVLDALVEMDDRPLVIFDPSPIDGAADILAHPAVDITKPNAHEYDALAPVWDTFDGVVCQTRGAEAVLINGAAIDRPSRQPPELSAVNTTGSGDIFIGTLAAGLASEVDLDTAIDRAMVAGSLAVQLPTVHQSVPAPAAIDAMLRTDR